MSKPSFAQQVAASVLYSGASSVAARLLNAGALFYTLKIISESEFGIAALAIAFFNTAKALTELGLGAAIIQEKRIGRIHIDSLFWVSFMISVALYVILYFGAPLVAAFYDTEVLSPMIRIYMIGIVAFSFYMISSKLLTRELAFKEIAIIDNVALAASAGLMIYLASTGWGAWAIVLAELAHKVGQMILSMFFKPYFPRFQFSYKKVKHLISFGLYTAGSNTLQKLYINADYLIIGKFFSLELVGIYSFAYRLVFDTVQELSSVTMSKASMLLVGTVMIIVGTYIDWFLPLVGYEKWMDAVPFMRIFVIVGIVQCLITLLPKLINAKGQARFVFYFTLTNAILLPIGFLLAAQISMMAVALVWLTLYPVISMVIFYFGAKVTETNPWYFGFRSFSALYVLIPLTGIAIGTRYGVNYLFGGANLYGVILACLFMIGLSAAVIWFTERKTIKAIKG